MEKLIQSSKTRPKADCGSDNELLISEFRLKLKNVRNITRIFRYDLNHILCEYAVEVGEKKEKRFQG